MKARSVLAGSALALAALMGAAGTANAEKIELAPKAESYNTGDNWSVDLSLTNESWVKLAPQNLTGTTREGLGTVRGTLNVTGAGESDLNGMVIRVGYLVGCFVNLNGVNLGASMTISPSVGINTVGPQASLGGQIGPSLTAAMTPGEIKAYTVQEKKAEATRSIAEINDLHVNTDGCLGPVVVRSYMIFTADTKVVKSTKTIYGDAFAI